jgi:hypothetical protein
VTGFASFHPFYALSSAAVAMKFVCLNKKP